MKQKTSFYRLLTLIVVVTLFLVACGGKDGAVDEDAESAGPDVEAEADEESLIIGISNNIDSVNPFQRTGTQSTYVQRFFYETLLNMVGPTEFEPRLADIETEDNQTFTVTINKEAEWTDGEPVTVDDLVYTINTTAHPDTVTTQSANIAMIEGTDEDGKLADGETEVSGLEVVDDYTLDITTKSPLDINYFSEFFGNNVMIAPEHVFSEYEPGDIHTSPAATNPTVMNGAYTLVENKENDYAHLEANPNYYRGTPKIDHIYVRILSGTAMVTDLQAGDIDMIAGGGISVLSPTDIPILEESDHLDIDSYPSVGVQYLLPNIESERFADPKVRQALAYAVDRELAIENLLLGNGEVPATPYTSVSEYKSEDIEPFPYDENKAQKLLEEANFDFDEPVTFIVPTGNAIREQMAELVQQNLEAIGMNIQMETYDFTTWINTARESDFDIGIIGMSHYYDPNVQNYFSSGGGNNLGFYKDEKMDDLIREGNAGTSFEERQPIYEELQEYFVDEMPTIPLYSEYDDKVQDSRLVGGVDEFWPASIADVQEWHFEE